LRLFEPYYPENEYKKKNEEDVSIQDGKTCKFDPCILSISLTVFGIHLKKKVLNKKLLGAWVNKNVSTRVEIPFQCSF